MSAAAKAELRDLIAGRLMAGMTPAQAADEVMKLFYAVESDWTDADTTLLGDAAPRRLHQRSLVATVFRDSFEEQRVSVEEWRPVGRSEDAEATSRMGRIPDRTDE